jgi:hypothetical protein
MMKGERFTAPSRSADSSRRHRLSLALLQFADAGVDRGSRQT